MKLERTIARENDATVKTVSGKVRRVISPKTVVLTLEDGTNQQFTIPKDQKVNIDGQMMDAFGLRKGMKISATKIVGEPRPLLHRRLEASCHSSCCLVVFISSCLLGLGQFAASLSGCRDSGGCRFCHCEPISLQAKRSMCKANWAIGDPQDTGMIVP